MRLGQRLQERYQAIRADCAIVAASDNKHMPYLVNALLSLQQCFPDHPAVTVHDIGLSALNRVALKRFPAVVVEDMPAFAPHWRLNWSWKLHALKYTQRRYTLYLDLPNFVVLRSLATWFLAIQRHGYFLLGNAQRLDAITPSSYWSLHGLDGQRLGPCPTFGAGILGFDRQSASFESIGVAHASMMNGLNLGRSADEPNRKYQPDLIRDCRCFRADQTLLNLAFRQRFPDDLVIRGFMRHVGNGGQHDSPNQYLWYARQHPSSLRLLANQPLSWSPIGIVNQAIWRAQITAVQAWRAALAAPGRA
jgi:hypothetical protein